ncbi:DMT family transporter [Tissierella sp. MSJ-40]|uniref:DMT family transporter n=1 Tax=Tissierella simiarum TaxID=2841534 RepID=A0ABS6E7H6_9FIRM|nr:DMT family transporter [Tissierella simiarum]MBU5438873.1 DMT family transporter [Tissierella simiarum]
MAEMNNASALEIKKQMDAKFSRQGVAQGLLSGITFAINGVIIGLALTMAPFTSGASVFVAPLVGAAMNDGMAAIWLLIYNIFKGNFREIGRSFKTFPGFMVCMAAVLGGPIANGAYLLAIQFAGPAYAIPISALCPVVGAILGRIFLKQKISPRVAFGMLICVAGAILIGYVPPEGNSPNFYLGIICAIIAAFGWGAEGVLSAFGMSMVDPNVAINIRQATSGIIFTLVVLPLVAGFRMYGELLATPSTLVVVAMAALAAAISFLSWYKANSSIGVARGMALNITYSLWGIVFSFFLGGVVLTKNLVIGAIAVFIGALLVVINPLEMFSKGE